MREQPIRRTSTAQKEERSCRVATWITFEPMRRHQPPALRLDRRALRTGCSMVNPLSNLQPVPFTTRSENMIPLVCGKAQDRLVYRITIKRGGATITSLTLQTDDPDQAVKVARLDF